MWEFRNFIVWSLKKISVKFFISNQSNSVNWFHEILFKGYESGFFRIHSVRSVWLEPNQYFWFTNRGQFLKSPENAIKINPKKCPPHWASPIFETLRRHWYSCALAWTVIMKKIFIYRSPWPDDLNDLGQLTLLPIHLLNRKFWQRAVHAMMSQSEYGWPKWQMRNACARRISIANSYLFDSLK